MVNLWIQENALVRTIKKRYAMRILVPTCIAGNGSIKSHHAVQSVDPALSRIHQYVFRTASGLMFGCALQHKGLRVIRNHVKLNACHKQGGCTICPIVRLAVVAIGRHMLHV